MGHPNQKLHQSKALGMIDVPERRSDFLISSSGPRSATVPIEGEPLECIRRHLGIRRWVRT